MLLGLHGRGLAVHVLEVSVLHEDVHVLLRPAGDVLHVVGVIDPEIPNLVPSHLAVTHQGIFCG